MFPPDRTLISASAAPHCGDENIGKGFGKNAGEWSGKIENIYIYVHAHAQQTHTCTHTHTHTHTHAHTHTHTWERSMFTYVQI